MDLEFRIFDKEVSPPRLIYLHDNKNYKITLGGSVVYNDIYVNKCKISLFTGLLDINDTKIFQGDILEHKPYGLIKKVIFKNSSFMLDDSISLCAMWLENTKHLEVIGNIYQNPELFKQ